MHFNIKAAEYLRSSYRAVQRYLADGRITCTKPVGKILINEQDLIDFVQMVNKSSFVEAKKEAERLTGLTLPSLDTYKDNGYTIDNTNRKTGFIDAVWRYSNQ